MVIGIGLFANVVYILLLLKNHHLYTMYEESSTAFRGNDNPKLSAITKHYDTPEKRDKLRDSIRNRDKVILILGACGGNIFGTMVLKMLKYKSLNPQSYFYQSLPTSKVFCASYVTITAAMIFANIIYR